jgi:hypothetical protein
VEQRVLRACDRGGPPPDTVRRDGGFHDRRSGSHSAREPDPGWAQGCRNKASSPVWTRRNRYPTTNSNRSAPWTLERLNGCRRVDANPTIRRQRCRASGFCRCDSTRILFTGDGDVPRLVASLRPLAEHVGGRVHIDTLEVRTTTAITTFPESCCSSSTVGTTDIHQRSPTQRAVRHGCCRARKPFTHEKHTTKG